jgi:hypothetical protein
MGMGSQDSARGHTGLEDDVLVLWYEDVCAEPKACTRKMFQLAGLSWNLQSEIFVERTTANSARRSTLVFARSGYYGIFQDPLQSAHRKAIVLVRHPCGVTASLKRGRAKGYLRKVA